MKKSCSLKESKFVKSDKGDVVLGTTVSGTQEEHPDFDLLHVDKKLKESGRDEDQPSETSQSKNTSGSCAEKTVRTSPRLIRNSSTAPSKWIENSFGVKKSGEKVKSFKDDTESTKSNLKKKLNVCTNKRDVSQNNQELSLASSKIRGNLSNFNADVNEGSVTCNKSITSGVRTHKTANESKNIENDHLMSSEHEDRAVSPNFVVGKKRISTTDNDLDSSKKIKMEESMNDNHLNNNEEGEEDEVETGESERGDNLLKIELELEKKKKSTPFVMRDVETIVKECDSRNRKWKETFFKYDCPTRWGIPVVRNCSEKWDGKEIPVKLLHRYQKHLLSKNMFHPVFLPPNSSVYFDENASDGETKGQPSGDVGGDFKTESETGGRTIESLQESYGRDDPSDSSQNSSAMADNGGRMVLRNRNQYRPVVIEDDEDLSDDSDDWMGKQKSGKNKSGYRTPTRNSKNKKPPALNNQQLVYNMERCNINRKNGIKSDDIMCNNSLNEDDIDAKEAALAETMVCPICSLRFPKQLIESHATECATKTYKD